MPPGRLLALIARTKQSKPAGPSNLLPSHVRMSFAPEHHVRIPRSGARNATPIFAKLLRHVTAKPECGFDFVGTFLAPGRAVAPSALTPPGYPEKPVLLEAAGVYGGRGHVRGEALYILWRLEGNNWAEIGRAKSQAWEWSLDLGPIAKRAIEESTRTLCVEVLPSLTHIEKRIQAALDRVLTPLDRRDQRRVLAVIHDSLATRFCACAED
jgi:hypothetical protein